LLQDILFYGKLVGFMSRDDEHIRKEDNAVNSEL
jgi:hypothetical protein